MRASDARGRPQPSSKRRSAQASSPERGRRRETRLQNARSSSSSGAVMRQTSASGPGAKPSRPSASVVHGPPAVRVHADGPMQTGASSKSLRAVSRRASLRRAGSSDAVSPAGASLRRTARTAVYSLDVNVSFSRVSALSSGLGSIVTTLATSAAI